LKLFYRAVLGIAVFAFCGVFSRAALAQNPVPFINQSLVPDATAPGGEPFTLTVNGTGFASGSVVNWNGSALETQFINGSQLKATVPAAEIATARTASVTVVNPAPGGGASNVALFAVTTATSSVGFGPPYWVLTNSGWAFVGGNFNGDGRTDLALSNYRLSVVLANADGTFQAPVEYDAGNHDSWLSVATADVNGDGKLDLIAASYYQTVAVLLGNGDGTFQPHIDSPGVTGGIATGDFNGDGRLDLAVSDGSTVYILLGNGDGTFQAPADAKTGTGSYRPAAVGDFNGDGRLDLAVPNDNDSTVSILLVIGDGTFSTGSTPGVGLGPITPAVGDFNGDGKLDLAVGGSQGVSILLGIGDGTFSTRSTPGGGLAPSTVGGGRLQRGRQARLGGR